MTGYLCVMNSQHCCDAVSCGDRSASSMLRTLDWAVMVGHFSDHCSSCWIIPESTIKSQFVVEFLTVFDFEIHWNDFTLI